jgi:hypothetical protein
VRTLVLPLVLLAALGCGSSSSTDAGPSSSGDGGQAHHDGGPANDGGLTSNDGGVTPADGGINPSDPGTLTAGARFITADATQFTIDEVGAAVDHALANGAARHIIIYVHGRACGGGGEPSKSLSGAVPELEADYGAKVLMFTWPGSSTGCPLGFPESQARESGLPLAHALHKLAYVVGTRGAAWSNVTFTLITHSMGNLVLEEALEKDTRPFPPALFATVMLNSSATALASHAAWLSKLRFSQRVFVSENDKDLILAAAGTFGARLGKNLGSEPLAPNAAYVDFTAADVNHAYYLHSGMKGAHMRAFYDAVMKGKSFDFASSGALTRTDARDGTFIYVFDGL